MSDPIEPITDDENFHGLIGCMNRSLSEAIANEDAGPEVVAKLVERINHWCEQCQVSVKFQLKGNNVEAWNHDWSM